MNISLVESPTITQDIYNFFMQEEKLFNIDDIKVNQGVNGKIFHILYNKKDLVGFIIATGGEEISPGSTMPVTYEIHMGIFQAYRQQGFSNIAIKQLIEFYKSTQSCRLVAFVKENNPLKTHIESMLTQHGFQYNEYFNEYYYDIR